MRRTHALLAHGLFLALAGCPEAEKTVTTTTPTTTTTTPTGDPDADADTDSDTDSDTDTDADADTDRDTSHADTFDFTYLGARGRPPRDRGWRLVLPPGEPAPEDELVDDEVVDDEPVGEVDSAEPVLRELDLDPDGTRIR